MNSTANEKHFPKWLKLKAHLHNVGRTPSIKEGEIWWAAVGENVGVEISGKNEVFSRPVLVFKKLSRCGFLAIPLTSQSHEGSWYVSFIFQNRRQTATLAQAKAMSVSRLYKKMGALSDSDFRLILNGFRKLYSDR